jgi:murein DD-endopeptidase MepM/ murein hydrolase activator NlpD
MGAGRFGAGRGGRTHEGQDTMAACGTPLVAARGGVVQYSGYQSLAGNYVVIDGRGTPYDFMYAHLAEPSPLQTGETVRTGQPIGVVGETGDATACHLHFEIWSAPGWYEGGSPLDPLPYLEEWDTYS